MAIERARPAFDNLSRMCTVTLKPQAPDVEVCETFRSLHATDHSTHKSCGFPNATISSSNLCRPFKLGIFELKHRVVTAPLTRLLTNENHVHPPLAVEYYTQCASEGGLVIAEATVVSLEFCGGKHTPAIWTRTQMVRWKKITDAVQANKTRIFLSIDSISTLWQTQLFQKIREPASPAKSAMVCRCDLPSKSLPDALDEEEIESTTRAFVQAARNAMAAPVDGGEVGANGYFVYQFLHRQWCTITSVLRISSEIVKIFQPPTA